MKVLKKVAIGAGYVVFFLLCTALFVRFLFPTEQAKDFAAQRLAELTGAESVTIADLGLTGLIPSGVEIEGLEMKLPGIKMKTPERGGSVISDPRLVMVDELTIKAGIGGLLDGAPDVSFDARIGTGTIRGARYVREKDGPHIITVERIENIPLGPERLFHSLVGFDIRGKLSGMLNLTIPVGERDGRMQTFMDQMAGKIEVQLSDAVVWSPIVDTAQGRMALTDIELGSVRLALNAEGGLPATGQPAGDPKARVPKGRDATVVSIEEATVDGPDLGVVIAPRGNITFSQGAGPKDATINVHLGLKIEDALVDKEIEDPKNPGKMTKPNVGLKYMMQANPIKNHVTDGQLGISITGTLGDVKVRTERPRARVGGSAGPSRKMNLDHPEGGDEGDGDDTKKPTDSSVPSTPPAAADVPSRRPPSVARTRPAQPSVPVGQPGPPSNRPRPVIPTEPLPSEPVVEEPAEPEVPVEVPVDAPEELPPGEVPLEGEGEHDPNAPIEEPAP